MLKKNIVFNCIAALGLILSSITYAWAQATDAPVLIRVNQLQLNPGMIDEFRDLHRDVYMPIGRENGSPWRLTTMSIFGDSFQMVIGTPLTNYAQLDGSGGFSQSDMASTTFGAAVQSRRSFIVQARPELGIAGGSGVQPLRRVVRILVAPGKIPEFETFWTNTIIPALSQSGVAGYQVFQTVMGGPQGEYFGGLYFPDFASLDEFNPTGGLTARAATALQEEFGELVAEFEVSFVGVDMDLSYGLANTQP